MPSLDEQFIARYERRQKYLTACEALYAAETSHTAIMLLHDWIDAHRKFLADNKLIYEALKGLTNG